jgi:hypothetical protein
MPTITRTQLRNAIEVGIASCSPTYHSVALAAVLRDYADTTDRVVVGDWYNRDAACGCPLHETGIIIVADGRLAAGPTLLSAGSSAAIADFDGFWLGFDNYVRSHSQGGAVYNGDVLAVV